MALAFGGCGPLARRQSGFPELSTCVVRHEKNRLRHEPPQTDRYTLLCYWMANALDPLAKFEEDNAVLAYLGGQRFLDGS
jgi:hypothetical protein